MKGIRLDKVLAARTAKTVYRDGDYAVKVFNEGYSKADVLNEAHNHALVEETALDVPQIEALGMIEGKWAIVMDYIPGPTLARLMREHPENKQAYIGMMTELQMRMHAQTAPKLNYLRDKMSRKLTEARISPAMRYELQVRLDSLPAHTKVCHGDFQPSNIIIREGDGVPFIIDWSHATQGNASADAARTYLLFNLEGDFDSAEIYLKLFSQKSGASIKYVKKWLPIVAASQSVKGKPAEREFLMHWIDVVEYE